MSVCEREMKGNLEADSKKYLLFVHEEQRYNFSKHMCIFTPFIYIEKRNDFFMFSIQINKIQKIQLSGVNIVKNSIKRDSQHMSSPQLLTHYSLIQIIHLLHVIFH